MNRSLLKTMVAEAKTAARAAVKDTRRLLGQPNDPDLRLYNQLRPEDFQNMEVEHGPEQVAEYIRVMEAKRLQGG